MADEDLDLDESTAQEEQNKVEKRIKSLSEKVKTTSEEREAEKAAREKAEAEKAAALKDVDFFKNFNTTSAKYPGSTEYQDKIREKVMAGYDLEDATISILAKEGKFVPPVVAQPKESPMGGSATTTISKGQKSLSEMTQEEKREVLKDNLSL